MKLKTIEVEGAVYAEVRDGKPVYVDGDGKEVAFDAPGTRATITNLNREAKGHREAKEAAEERLKAFGDLDPSAARKAMETVANFDAKKLIDAGEVEKVRQEARDAFERQLAAVKAEYKPVEEKAKSLQAALEGERLGHAFAGSKFIADKLAIPADMARAAFGGSFYFDEGRLRARGADGNPMYSRERPGEPAEFEEAIGLLVESYPHRDSILKGSGAAGGGSAGSRGAGGRRTYTREQIRSMSPRDRMDVNLAAGRGEVDLTD